MPLLAFSRYEPVKATVKVKNKPQDAIKQLERLNKEFRGDNRVKVGLPKNSNAYPDGTSVIMVGAVHEFGSPSRNIPQRSFLRTGIIENRKVYISMARALLSKVIEEKMSMHKALSLIGLQAQTDVRDKITDIEEPPLKYRDGNPLVDTGHLRQSITYQIGDD